MLASLTSFLQSVRTIKVLMLASLSFLTGAILVSGWIAWYSLDRANEKLGDQYQETIEVIADSLQLANRSSGLVSSAPYLLTLSSIYQIEEEGSRLLSELSTAESQYRNTIEDWEHNTALQALLPRIQSNLSAMRSQVAVLVNASQTISETEDLVRIFFRQLSGLHRTALRKAARREMSPENKQAWQQIAQSADLLISASRVTDFLSLGELRRRYQVLIARNINFTNDPAITEAREGLIEIANGEGDLFSLRHRIIANQLDARSALLKIKAEAQAVTVLVKELVGLSREDILQQQKETAEFIGTAQQIIFATIVISVLVALASAQYLAMYVVRNINRISHAMAQLAKGDHATQLPRPKNEQDEVGRLMKSFRIFRANALRLRRLNAQLKLKSDQLETTFNCISDGLVLTDERYQIIAWNPRLLQVLQVTSDQVTSAKTLLNLFKLAPFNWQSDQVRPHGSRFRFAELRGQGGATIDVRKNQLPEGGAIWSFSDETDRRLLREQAHQKEKLESLGQLTGEVAHDFNNILTGISGSVGVIEHKTRDNPEMKSSVQRIYSAVEIATNLTQRLLAFARKQRLEPEVVELRHLIDCVAEILPFSLGEQIQLHTELPEHPVYVRIDPGQLESALINLCINSGHAIEAKHPTGEGSVLIAMQANGSETVSIRVEDDGCGMDAATLERAYEPFFTTRRASAGSGLGLSMVFGFITQSGGEMAIRSHLGEGTTVTLVIPQAHIQEKGQAEAKSFAKDYSVLLVEDDLQIRLRARAMLKEMGLTCLEAASFGEARMLIEKGTKIDLLFSDVHLEDGKNGWSLADQLLKAYPEQRVVMTSGHAVMPNDCPHIAKDHVLFLPKPYDKEQLYHALKQLF